MSFRTSKKRKPQPQSDSEDGLPGNALDMEMLSDEEHDDEPSDDDGQLDDFPELDAGSDSEDTDDGLSDENGADEGEESDNDDDALLRDEGHPTRLFPKPKTQVSEITGQPKRVYPEIEPDYDSDSSTEDVSGTPNRYNISDSSVLATQQGWKHTNALV